MSNFPELPPLPDIGGAARGIASGINNAIEGLRDTDKAREAMDDFLKEGKQHLERLLKRPPPF